MNDAVFDKIMENVQKYRNIQFINDDKGKMFQDLRQIVTSKKQFYRKLLATEMRKTHVKKNKLVYLGFSIFDLNKN